MPSRAIAPQAAALLAAATGQLRAGRPDAAIPNLRAALLWLPGDAAILHDLGLACLECGDLGEAITALRGAVDASPGFADAHLRLGIAWEAAGQVDAALAAYRAAWAARPGLADARFRAGNLLETLGRTAEAADAFRRAAASAPRTTAGRIATARALLLLGRDAEAQKTLRQALALEKDNAAALELLGNSLADGGRFEEARAFLLSAVARDPTRSGSYYDIVRCGPFRPWETALLRRMRAAVSLPGLEPAQRSRVHLALGKALADLGDHRTAMACFDRAEALRNTVLRYDPAAFEARVARMVDRFTPAMPAHAPTPGARRPTPILILGLPRSGTTLVEQILAAHPNVCAGGELSFWGEHGAVWDATWPDGAARAAFLDRAAADYRALLRGIGGSATHVTDKMPLNIQWAGLIRLAVPDAIIVQCRRNLLDTALSIHQTHFNPRMAFPTGGAALVAYARATDRLAAHWRGTLPATHFFEISYETLVTEPEPTIRALLASCGLAWNAACLRPELNASIVKTPSKWQARQPIHPGAIDGWRAYEACLGPLRALLPATAGDQY